jgi:hypothetical protein
MTEEEMTSVETSERSSTQPTAPSRDGRDAARDQREAERQEAVRLNLEDKRSIVEDLRAIGITVSVRDSSSSVIRWHPEAIPVLVDHLSRPHRPDIKMGIARALAVREARELAAPVVLREFLASDEEPMLFKGEYVSGYKWTLAWTLSVIATEAIADDLIAAIHDPRHHIEERRVLVGALGRCWRLPRALQALRDLTTDPELGEAAHKTLRRFRKA